MASSSITIKIDSGDLKQLEEIAARLEKVVGELAILTDGEKEALAGLINPATKSNITKKNKWAYSTDGENYYGVYDSREGAIREGREACKPGKIFWIGQSVSPASPETYWDAWQWLDSVSESGDEHYGGEWAEGWDRSTADQRAEIERIVRSSLRQWLIRHDLMPKFYNVDPASISKHVA